MCLSRSESRCGFFVSSIIYRQFAMRTTALIEILGYVWAAFGVYWLVAARVGKAARVGESSLYRLVRLLLLGIAFTLLFSQRTAVGFLGRRFVPGSSAI